MLRLLVLTGCVLATLGSPMAVAENAKFFTVRYIEVGPVLAKVGALALTNYLKGSKGENGMVDLDALQQIDRPSHFAVLGEWSDPAAYQAHLASESSKRLNEKLATLLAAPVDAREHNPLAVARPKTGKDAIVVVTHIDVPPTQKDSAIAAIEQFTDESRRHAGNLQMDVWQQTERPNHFTLVEVWNTRGAFDLHQMQKETREFRGKLGPMLGALYDQRIYKPLR